MHKYNNNYDKENNRSGEDIYINILIRDKNFNQYCGKGYQKIRWLTDCAIFKYETLSEKKMSLGTAYGLKSESGNLCDLDSRICDCLTNGSNVMVLLKEEFEVEREEKEKLKKNKNSLDDNDNFIVDFKNLNNFHNEGIEKEEELNDDNYIDDIRDSNNNDEYSNYK